MTPIPKDLSVLFAMHELGLLSPSGFRSAALSGLTEPAEPDLLQLAICDAEDAEGIARAASALFARRGLLELKKADVLRLYAAYVAHLIVRGDLLPREGADLIASVTERHPVNDFHDLDAFRYASSEMQDRPEDQAFFEKAIMEEAIAWDARREGLRSSTGPAGENAG